MLLKAFLVGGAICVVGQLLIDICRLDFAHTMCTLVVLGAIFSFFNLYQPLVDFAGAGATTPIASFGNALLEGAREGMREHGFVGIFTGLFNSVSAGIGGAVFFGFLVSLIFRPKG